LGANITQTIKAFREAEAYDGPSIIIAYSHCINHGIDMAKGPRAAESGGNKRPVAPSTPQGSGQESLWGHFRDVNFGNAPFVFCCLSGTVLIV
jgi:hypothetical protein